jgi:hypothetical protein
MNPLIGWSLAVAALVLGWQLYAWQGVVMAITLIVFWLVLQFNRALRVMKNAASAPIGHVDSAVMFHARLRAGLTLVQVVALTRSLGRKEAADPETWSWVDGGGTSVNLVFVAGKLRHWSLQRTASPDESPGAVNPAPGTSPGTAPTP